MTNPEVLRLADEIAGQGRIVGSTRWWAAHDAAIKAIEKTAELNAEMLDRLRMHTCAKFTRSYNHLRQSEKDNSDAD